MGNGLAYERIHIFNEVFLNERLWIDMGPQVFQHLFFAPCLTKRFRFKYGIFRAIGFRKSHIFKIVLLEAGFISAVAGMIGYGAGFGAAKGALRFFSESGGASVQPSFDLAMGAFGLAVLVGVVSSIYPAFLATRMDPNQALNTL